VIAAATSTIVTTVPVGVSASAVVYDSGNGDVFVANSASATVSVVSDVTNTVVATVPVGGGPESAVYDSGTGEVFVGNFDQGTVSILSLGAHAVRFTESGLPNGTVWGVSTANGSFSSTGPTITFAEPSGIYAYALEPVNGYVGTPSNSSFVVLEANQNLTVEFTTAPGPSGEGLFGLPGYDGFVLVGGIAVVAALLAVWGRTRGRHPVRPGAGT